MSEKYIPTTDEVRNHYDPSCEPRFQDNDRLYEHIPAEFDRWLTAHDARVRREALELSDEEACAALEGIARFMDDDPEPMDDGLPIEMAQAAFAAVADHREASDVRA